MLLICIVALFFLVSTPSITGFSILKEDVKKDSCFLLDDGRTACYIRTFEVDAGKVINNNFVYLDETEQGNEN